MTKEVEKIIVDIIKSELELPDYYDTDKNTPSIVIGFQNFKMGNVDDLQVVVSSIDSSIIASTNKLDADEETETQRVVMRETIQIDLVSRNNEARQKRANILMALESYYSLSQQEKYQFKIFRSPTGFVNTSDAEGGSNVNRFTISIPVHVWYENIKTLEDIYETFPARVDDENTIGESEGMIEFEI